ncbi:MAG: rhomboid family intramembrane serine protease [Armatimonadota bacterium]
MRRVDDFGYWLKRGGMPVTKGLMVVNAVTLLLSALFKVNLPLAFNTLGFIREPWTALTYPLQSPLSLISVLFAFLWLWFAGGSLERSWGSRTFAIFFFVISAVSALGLFAGSLITGVPVALEGLWLPLAGVTIAFAMLNPEQEILFYFVLPLKLKYLALLDVVFVLISYGQMNLLLGIFALSGCAAAYWYVRQGRGLGRRSDNVIRIDTRPGKRGGGWYKERKERKQLEDLFRRSGLDD